MSQYWHGHWTNEAFRPVRLQNWEVPNWHPCWPDQHCTVTQFVADNRGRILVGKKKSTRSPWGDFKGTWELPKKISRQQAYELSAPPRQKIKAWEEHKKINKENCRKKNNYEVLAKEAHIAALAIHSSENIAQVKVSQEPRCQLSRGTPRIADTTPKTPCQIHDTCSI